MDHVRFDAADSSLILSCAKGAPLSILYWGERLDTNVDIAALESLFFRQAMHGVADIALPLSLAMEPGLGHPILYGFAAHRAGKDWASLFEVGKVEMRPGGARIICRDKRTELGLEYEIHFDPSNGVLRIRSSLTNYGGSPLDVNEMMTACLQVPEYMTDIIGFSGRWTQEFVQERSNRTDGTYLRENRSGRTSHFSYPAVLLTTADTNENAGAAYGFHLAFSGNHRLRVDSLTDGRVLVSLGALFLPGEVRLQPGESLANPEIVAAYSGDGLSAPQAASRPLQYMGGCLFRP
jgi:alpha-galactosidase